MAETTLRAALDAGLTVEDFEGVEYGFEDRYTGSQVREIIARKEAVKDAPRESEG
jgi:hypothetical protein